MDTSWKSVICIQGASLKSSINPALVAEVCLCELHVRTVTKASRRVGWRRIRSIRCGLVGWYAFSTRTTPLNGAQPQLPIPMDVMLSLYYPLTSLNIGYDGLYCDPLWHSDINAGCCSSFFLKNGCKYKEDVG